MSGGFTSSTLTAAQAAFIDASISSRASSIQVRSTTEETGTDSISGSAGGSWRQLVAATAAALHKITLVGSLTNNDSANPGATVQIGTGGAGSEIVRATSFFSVVLVSSYTFFKMEVQINLTAGTRVAWKPALAAGLANIIVGYTIEED